MHGYRLPVAYWIMKAIISPFLYLLWRVRVEGREHIPADGPVILAANHQSFCDSFFLPLVVRRRVTYVAKAEYFDSWKTAWFFRAAGQIPMNRSGGDASQRALDTATEVLQGGGVLAIYPEGTRAPDARLHKGKTGRRPAEPRLRRPGGPGRPGGDPDGSSPPGSMVMRPFHTVTVRFGPPVAYEFDGRRVTTGSARRGPATGRGPTAPRRRPGGAAGADRRPDAGDRRPVGPGVRRRVRQPQEGPAPGTATAAVAPGAEFVTGSKPCRHIPALP